MRRKQQSSSSNRSDQRNRSPPNSTLRIQPRNPTQPNRTTNLTNPTAVLRVEVLSYRTQHSPAQQQQPHKANPTTYRNPTKTQLFEQSQQQPNPTVAEGFLPLANPTQHNNATLTPHIQQEPNTTALSRRGASTLTNRTLPYPTQPNYHNI